MTQTQKNARKEQYKNWLKENVIFSKIVMTDEKLFRLDGPQNGFSYYSQHNNIQKRQTRQQGGGGLMVHWYSDVVRFDKKIFCPRIYKSDAYKQLLQQKVFLYIESKRGKDFIFQQDGDPVHTSNLFKDFLKTRNLLKWLAKSLDLNLTEKLWAWMSEKVYKSGQIFNVGQLKEFNIAIKVIESEKKQYYSGIQRRV